MKEDDYKKSINEFGKKLDNYEMKKITNLEDYMDDEILSVKGRIKSIRKFGKLIFADLYSFDETIQISFSKNDFENLDKITKMLNVGDNVIVCGKVYTTRIGKKTLNCNYMSILSKSTKSFPEKYHGLRDRNIKREKKFLDVISSEITRLNIQKKIDLLKSIRNILLNDNFEEIMLPLFEKYMSSKSINDFNDYDKLYLYYAELCGMQKFYTFSKEYQITDKTDQIIEHDNIIIISLYYDEKNIEKTLQYIITTLIKQINHTLVLNFQGLRIDFENFKKINFQEELSKFFKDNIQHLSDINKIKNILISNNIFLEEKINNISDINILLQKVFQQQVIKYIIQPTFVYNYEINKVELYVNSELIGESFINSCNENYIINNGNNKDFEKFNDELSYGIQPSIFTKIDLDNLIKIINNNLSDDDNTIYPKSKILKINPYFKNCK